MEHAEELVVRGATAADRALTAGLLSYDVSDQGLEIVSLDATVRHGGVGTALLAARRIDLGVALLPAARTGLSDWEVTVTARIPTP